MIDHNDRHELDDSPKTEPVASEDIIGSDAERAEFFKRMAFEADRACKQADAALIDAKLRIEAMRHLVKAADKELETWQNSRLGIAGRGVEETIRLVANARAALKKAVEE